MREVSLDIAPKQITAMIGPSGCGKSTVLRCLNRTNDLIVGARVEGKVAYRGDDLYANDVDPIEVRRRIGMVFQKPNPFPKSIYDNVAYGPRVNSMKVDSMDDVVEQALRSAALWDEVKDKIKASALALSGGQQQRLCIARVSHKTAFFNADVDSEGKRHGRLVEYDTTTHMFERPNDPRTEDYISGRFG